jgi:hypothetical protein
MQSSRAKQSFRLDSAMSPEAVAILLTHDLQSRASEHCDRYRRDEAKVANTAREDREIRRISLAQRLQEDQEITATMVERKIKEFMMRRFSYVESMHM